MMLENSRTRLYLSGSQNVAGDGLKKPTKCQSFSEKLASTRQSMFCTVMVLCNEGDKETKGFLPISGFEGRAEGTRMTVGLPLLLLLFECVCVLRKEKNDMKKRELHGKER